MDNGAEALVRFYYCIPRAKARGNNLNSKILFSFYGYKARGNNPNSKISLSFYRI